MKQKNLDKKVERLEAAVTKRLAEIRAEVEKKKFAIVPRGKYKGRRAMIAGVSFSTHGGVIVLLYPFRIDNPEELTSNSHGDARTYWPYKELEFCN